jgi:3-oxoacyl-[acyl-carrier-protein] synthase-1
LKNDVVVTGIGLLTSVGRDAVQTAVAVRAGINRFRQWAEFPLATAEEPAVVVAAVLPSLGNGPWVDKWEALLELPTREALWQAGLPEIFAGGASATRLGAYLAVPAAARPGVSAEERAGFVTGLNARWPGTRPRTPVVVTSADHAGGLEALLAAQRDLRARAIDVAVVGAIDSHLHEPHLADLLAAERLKTLLGSEGLIPGEAGAVLVLERTDHATRRRANPLARLGEIVMEREPVPLGLEQPITGEALARSLQALFAHEAPAALQRVYVDLSGERWRFVEWALVETRCSMRFPAGWRLCHPADCLGDVGAATGLVHIALVVRSFARRYAGGGSALLINASAGGERATAVIHPAAPGRA